MRAAGMVVAVLLVAAGIAAPSAAAPSAPVRIERHTLTSELLGGEALVDVIVPADYRPSDAPHPVAVFMTGGVSQEDPDAPGFADLIAADAGAVMARLGIVGVVPHTQPPWVDPVEPDTGPLPRFPTAKPWGRHVAREVLPFVRQTYRVAQDRWGTGVFGISTGAYGAQMQAVRYPDEYAFVGAASGAIDPKHPLCVTGVCQVMALMAGGRDVVTDEIYWRGHSPADLSPNYRSAPTTVVMSVGDGQCAADDSPGSNSCNPAVQGLEAGMRIASDDFSARLTAEGVEHTYIKHLGTHSERYIIGPVWGRTVLPLFAKHAARGPRPLKAWRYQTTHRTFDVFGWSFSVERGNTEFTYLRDVSEDGLVVRGSGTLTVTTAPLYRPGGRYQVRAGEQPGKAVTADRDGRLTFTAQLAPARPYDQHSVLEAAGLFGYADLRVRISRSRR